MSHELLPELWPGWETVRVIGHGSFGAVYEIRQSIGGHIDRAALKVLHIPKSHQDIEKLRSEAYDDASITRYFSECMQEIENEYALMAELKGHANIVYCDSIRRIQHNDGFGWDVYIKMELLTPLKDVFDRNDPVEQTIRLGKDLCSALTLCEQYAVIHRDIKPDNIFMARDGNFKLGDFGIAKTMENTTTGTKAGTYDFMAPEVYNNRPYGHQADVYSLGMVMYWMLNEQTGPFIPAGKKPTPTEKARARDRRFSGASLPPPRNENEELAQIVLKACAYDPEKRYRNAAELRRDLETVERGTVIDPPPPPPPSPFKKWYILAAILAIALFLGSIAVLVSRRGTSSASPTVISATPTPTSIPLPTPASEEIAVTPASKQVPVQLWSDWSDWSDVSVSNTATVEVETRTRIIGYNMVHYGTQMAESPHYRMFRNYSIQNQYEKYGARDTYAEKHYTRYVTKADLDKAEVCTAGEVITGDYPGYQCGDTDAYFFGDDKYVWFIESVDEITEYRYRYLIQ